MKSFLISILFVGAAIWPGHDLDLPKRAQKKIAKAIAKVWKDQELKQEVLSLEINDAYLKKCGYLTYRLKKEQSIEGYAFIKRTKACRAGGCTIETDNSGFSGDYEYFDFLMLLDTDMNVLRVEVVNYQAQYGYEICNKRWLKQFKGFNGRSLNYGKDIQAISGATVSASAITDDVQVVYSVFRKALEARDQLN